MINKINGYNILHKYEIENITTCKIVNKLKLLSVTLIKTIMNFIKKINVGTSYAFFV